MKERKDLPILTTHYPLQKRNFKKRWLIAKDRTGFETQKMQNKCLEQAYHHVINAVKQYLKPTELFYYCDHKTDHSLGTEVMHCFITPNFYWQLQCDYFYCYNVEFVFENCLYEAEIRALMQRYPLDRTTKEKALLYGLKAFYFEVLTLYDEKTIGSLASPPLSILNIYI